MQVAPGLHGAVDRRTNRPIAECTTYNDKKSSATSAAIARVRCVPQSGAPKVLDRFEDPESCGPGLAAESGATV